MSVEPYPISNLIDQDFGKILESISFIDKIIFDRLNYIAEVSAYKDRKEFFNDLTNETISFYEDRKRDYHIKNGTISDLCDK